MLLPRTKSYIAELGRIVSQTLLSSSLDLFRRTYEDDHIKRMRWVGLVARMGKEGSLHTTSYYENLKERDDV